jgi:hypothetical protein
MSTALAAMPRIDPNRYYEAVGDTMSPVASAAPVCLYLDTNRCNLL